MVSIRAASSDRADVTRAPSAGSSECAFETLLPRVSASLSAACARKELPAAVEEPPAAAVQEPPAAAVQEPPAAAVEEPPAAAVEEPPAAAVEEPALAA
eukprot:6205536-Pleurochrysis_carterae.AAC.1